MSSNVINFPNQEVIVLPKMKLVSRPASLGIVCNFMVESVFTGRIMTIRIDANTRDADISLINSLDDNSIYDWTVQPRDWRSGQEPRLYFKEVKES